ncbi:MAG: chemotaxis protein CheA [Oligoflexia bacterium]|nr:chemotaxis protein CheA [Oligoflexia bacterium]
MAANKVSESDIAFIEEFVVESFDILEDVEPQVVSSECLNKTLANNIFRLVHSIKGAAGFLKFTHIARVSHSAENILTFVRSNDRDYSDIGVDFLIKVFDFFRKTFGVIKKEYTDDSFKDDACNLVVELDKIMSSLNGKSIPTLPAATLAANFGPTTASAPASTLTPSPSISTSTPAATNEAEAKIEVNKNEIQQIMDIDDLQVLDNQDQASNHQIITNEEKTSDKFESDIILEKISVNNLNTTKVESTSAKGDNGMDDLLNEETFQIFCSEAKEIFEEAEQNLLEYSNNLSNNTLLLAIFRSVHTFKGNCGLFSLTKLAAVGHKLESLLEKMIQNQITINKELIELVIKLVDALKDGFNTVIEGRHDSWNEDAYIDIIDGVVSKHGVAASGGGPTSAVQAQPTEPTEPTISPVAVAEAVVAGTETTIKETQIVEASTFAQTQQGPTSDPAPILASAPALSSTNIPSKEVKESNLVSTASVPTAPLSTVPALSSPGPKKIELKEKTDNKIASKSKSAINSNNTGGGNSPSDNEEGSEGNKNIKFDRKDIRIEITKLDWLNDLVGELLIAKTMIYKDFDFSSKNIEKRRSFHFFSKVLSELQDVAMAMRMVPVSSLFKKMLRIVHDLENKTKKKVKIDFWGESTEVDKTVIEHINDPLLHILRNAVDHGVETPDERVRNGKPEYGLVRVGAVHEGGEVRIIISDDGKGLNRERIIEKAQQLELIHGDGHELPDSEIYKFIFAPGFSTAKEITDISGRGVGMDVVIQNVRKMNGRVDVASVPGKSTTFTIRIPLTLAIIEGMLVSCGGIKYTIPLESIRETIKVKNKNVSKIMQGQELIKIRDVMIPIVRLHLLHKVKDAITDVESGVLIVVEGHGRTIAILVDQLLGQYQTIIKSLPQYLNVIEVNNFKGISGCSIQGDGEVGLILDIGTLVELVEGSHNCRAA